MCKKSHVKDINPNTGKPYANCPECRERKNEYAKQYRIENPEYIKKYRSKNRDKHLEYMKEYNKRYHQNNPFKRWVKHSKEADIKSNRYDPDNFITEEYCEYITEQSNNKCHYCLCELNWEVGDTHTRSPNRATIERLDNSIGHVIGNCVVACNHCNVSKVGDRVN